MSFERTAALVAGLLQLAGTAAGILSIAPSLDAEDYLSRGAGDTKRVHLAALAQLVMGVAYGAVPLVLYPLLRRHSEVLTLGFLGLRMAAGAFILLGAIILLMLLTLTQAYARNQHEPTTVFAELGRLVRTARDLVNHFATVLLLAFAELLFYSLLFQAELVPRWLSVWGLLGASLAIVASLLFAVRVITLRSAAYFGLVLPLAVQELVLATWLVAVGLEA